MQDKFPGSKEDMETLPGLEKDAGQIWSWAPAPATSCAYVWV